MIQKLRKILLSWSLKQPKDPFSNSCAMPVNWDSAGAGTDLRCVFDQKSVIQIVRTVSFLKETADYTTPPCSAEICAKHFVELWSREPF